MMMKYGYAYLRDTEWCIIRNVIKMGITAFHRDRETTYITGEIIRGQYICVVEIAFNIMRYIDNCLKQYFKRYNIRYDGGKEYYDRLIFCSSLEIFWIFYLLSVTI
jgi:hypothetical protein